MPTYPSAFTNQQIANQLTRDGVHWVQTSLTYSFNDYSTAGDELDATQAAFINEAIAMVQELLNISFTQVASGGSITFNGNIPLSPEIPRSEGTFASLSWFEPSKDLATADVVLDQDWATNASDALSIGSYGFLTIIHEFLHALGLDHPGAYDATNGQTSYFPDAEYLQDTHRYTVMSYFTADYDGSGTSHWLDTGTDFEYRYAQTPMVYDILALTTGSFGGLFSGYALNATTRSGATIYGYNASAGINAVFDFDQNDGPVLTIYDAGGTDTLDLSGDFIDEKMVITYDAAGEPTATPASRTSSVINLNEGQYSSTHGMSNNIGIAFDTIIENAVGTVFDDLITGNGVANILEGGNGNDTILGGGGSDKLYGNDGVDNLDGGSSNDILYMGAGGGTANGGTGTDTLSYYSGTQGAIVDLMNQALNAGAALGQTLLNIERINGSNTGGDTLKGNASANTLAGYGGNDILKGNSGDDVLIGGAGADTLSGNAGIDKHKYEAVSHGGDTITYFSSADTFEFTKSAFGNLASTSVGAANFLSRTSGNAATTGNHRFIFDQSTDTLWYDSNGSGTGGLTMIADLQNDYNVLNSQLLLV
jgi:serralysin